MTSPCRMHVYCECGDRLIHQSSRGAHESSSLLGQHVHDSYPTKFDWMDIDGAVWKQSTRRLIVIEHKYPGQHLRNSQRRVLPVLGDILALAETHGLISHGRAVLLYGKPPFDHASVTVWPGRAEVDLNKPQVDALLQGEPVPPAQAVA